MFIVAISSAWARNLDISCGCFANAGPISDYRLEILGRLALLAVGVYLLVVTIRDKSGKTLAEEEHSS